MRVAATFLLLWVGVINAWKLRNGVFHARTSLQLRMQTEATSPTMSNAPRRFAKLASNVLGALLILSPMAAMADGIPAVGTSAPEFSLPSTTGKDISLQDLKGKRTVLYFYPVIKFCIHSLCFWLSND